MFLVLRNLDKKLPKHWEDLLNSQPSALYQKLHQMGDSIEQIISQNIIAKQVANNTTPLNDNKIPPQFIYDIVVIKARPFYGFYARDQIFIKIFVINPAMVATIASVLQSGKACNTSFQPYEAHIPYPLQFMIDNNLHGMDDIKLEKTALLFRVPVPQMDSLAFQSINTIQSPPKSLLQNILCSQTISEKFLMHEKFKRISNSELEIDIATASILNSKDVIKDDISSGNKAVKLVQSLSSIWEEEKFRRKQLSKSSQFTQAPPSQTRVAATQTEIDKVMKNRLYRLVDAIHTNEPKDNLEKEEEDVAWTSAEIENKANAQHEVSNNIPAATTSLAFLSQTNSVVIPNNLQLYPAEISKDCLFEEEDREVIDILNWMNQDSDIEGCPNFDEQDDEDGEVVPNNKSNEKLAHQINMTQKECDDIVEASQFVDINENLMSDDEDEEDDVLIQLDGPSDSKNGMIKEGEYVLLRSGKSKPFIGYVEQIVNEKYFQVKWFYRPEETHAGRSISFHKNEVFSSTVSDINKTSTIIGKCKVLSFDEFSALSEVNENIFFCRKEYDAVKKEFRDLNVKESQLEEEIESINNEKLLELTVPSLLQYKVAPPVVKELRSQSIGEHYHQVPYYSKQKDLEEATVQKFKDTKMKLPVYGTTLTTYTSPFATKFESEAQSKLQKSLVFAYLRKPPSINECNLHMNSSTKFTTVTKTTSKIDSYGRMIVVQEEVKEQVQVRPPSPKFDEPMGEAFVDQNTTLFSVTKTTQLQKPQLLVTNSQKVAFALSILSKGNEIPAALPTQISLTSFHCDGMLQGENAIKETLDEKEKSSTKEQNMTMISLEVACFNRGVLTPDPNHDKIFAIMYCIKEAADRNPENLVYGTLVATEEHEDALCLPNNVHITKFKTENALLLGFADFIKLIDPDIICGYEIQKESLGYLIERAKVLSGLDLCSKMSRMLPVKETRFTDGYGITHQSGIKVTGRIIVNVWRVMRSELKLNMYSFPNVLLNVLGLNFPSFPHSTITNLLQDAKGKNYVVNLLLKKSKLVLKLLDNLDVVNRTSELARSFGIDWFSVISRGSQYRVESVMFRLAKPRNYVLISPSKRQVASQDALESLPLVMEPNSNMYSNPVLVLDFQSLYPRKLFSNNIPAARLGILSQYEYDYPFMSKHKDDILITPNAVMFVKSNVRCGVLPRMLSEILDTRVMIKNAMKKVDKEETLYRILNARQFGLKMIANVTYGYSSANFSGRMPCSLLADSIVQLGRQTLERAIKIVENETNEWRNAKVVYGDTDSLFVEMQGYSLAEAFEAGNRIAAKVTAKNPKPVKLQFEKVFFPCFLVSKKRYVGYTYEKPTQPSAIFDAKGIETVRRDSCPIVQNCQEQVIRILFETRDISKAKEYLQKQFDLILREKLSISNFVFAKEVRLGTYSPRGILPPAALVAKKKMELDKRAEPLYAERIPYVVCYGAPGARLIDLVIDPRDFMEAGNLHIHGVYYITKQIIPAIDRLLCLIGVDVMSWFIQMPKDYKVFFAAHRISITKQRSYFGRGKQSRYKQLNIDQFYQSSKCLRCREIIHVKNQIYCSNCLINRSQLLEENSNQIAVKQKLLSKFHRVCSYCSNNERYFTCTPLDSNSKQIITADSALHNQCKSFECEHFFQKNAIELQLHNLCSIRAQLLPQENIDDW